MDAVEQTIRLPDGARRLEEYARYYALDEQKHVAAFYMIPDGPPDPDDKCWEITENLDTPEVPCGPPPVTSFDLPAGQRRWVGRSENLPFVADGGCSVVRVLFDPASRTIEQAYCHGGS